MNGWAMKNPCDSNFLFFARTRKETLSHVPRQAWPFMRRRLGFSCAKARETKDGIKEGWKE